MIEEGGLEGEGDLGGLGDRSGTSQEGSWTSLWDGVWLLEETCVMVGDTAARRGLC
jgi:hypothetical protein